TNLTNTFDGQSNFGISENESIGAGVIEIFQVEVIFTVDPEEVTPSSANCELTPGEDGTGLLNVAVITVGDEKKEDEICENIPQPAVTIVKTVSSSPEPTGNVNEYTISYEIQVSNQSAYTAFYDLTDTLKYGAGAIIGDVEVAYVAGGDGLGASLNPNFSGQPGNYLIVTNETIEDGGTDTYSVTVTFRVDPTAVTPTSGDCNLVPGEEGTGLLNVAEVSGGVPTRRDEDCEMIPQPSVLITKEVVDGPTPTGNVNEYTIAYDITVENTGSVPAFYDLRDTLQY